MGLISSFLEVVRVRCRETGLAVADEYEKTLLSPHTPERFCTIGLGSAAFGEAAPLHGGACYPLELALRMRVLDRADTAPAALLDALEEGVLSPLMESGYDLLSMDVAPLAYNQSLRKMELLATLRLRCSIAQTEASA